MYPRDLRIEDFTYALPDECIARYPLAERDASKLLIYKKGAISEDSYRNIADHIPESTLMVFNETKVVHARLLFKKPSGGAIEVFCLAPVALDIHTAMSRKGWAEWECLVGGASKWKRGTHLTLKNEEPSFTLTVHIVSQTESAYVVSFEWDNEQLTFADVLQHAGKVPLPPYLRREAEVADETAYQTVFAKDEGSVAAPTAGLHFTHRIMGALDAKKIEKAFVTLHVGAGTFRPVKSDTMAGHNMHAEWIDVSRHTIEQLLHKGDKKVVAVGTTSLRTLESLYWIGVYMRRHPLMHWHEMTLPQWSPYEEPSDCSVADALEAILHGMDIEKVDRFITRTALLIAPGYRFRIIDGLVTNFHQPQSTLLLLVAAFIGEDWHKVYDHALHHDFRFLSYGDGSLLWR